MVTLLREVSDLKQSSSSRAQMALPPGMDLSLFANQTINANSTANNSAGNVLHYIQSAPDQQRLQQQAHQQQGGGGVSFSPVTGTAPTAVAVPNDGAAFSPLGVQTSVQAPALQQSAQRTPLQPSAQQLMQLQMIQQREQLRARASQPPVAQVTAEAPQNPTAQQQPATQPQQQQASGDRSVMQPQSMPVGKPSTVEVAGEPQLQPQQPSQSQLLLQPQQPQQPQQPKQPQQLQQQPQQTQPPEAGGASAWERSSVGSRLDMLLRGMPTGSSPKLGGMGLAYSMEGSSTPGSMDDLSPYELQELELAGSNIVQQLETPASPNTSTGAGSPTAPASAAGVAGTDASDSKTKKRKAAEDDGNWQKRKKKKPSNRQNLVCHICQETETPEWRKGPDGNHTLCNACGLNYAKKMKQERMNLERQGRRKQSIDVILDKKKYNFSTIIQAERVKKFERRKASKLAQQKARLPPPTPTPAIVTPSLAMEAGGAPIQLQGTEAGAL